MPDLCSLLIMARSLHTDWMELKKPFQIQTHVSAREHWNCPSIVTYIFWPTTSAISAAIRADMGRTFQSVWKINMRKFLPR